MWMSSEQDPLCTSSNEESGLLANNAPLTKTQGELCQMVRLTPKAPRVVLKSNSQCGQQDPQSLDARSSWEPSSDSKNYVEICNNTVDYRISGVPLSAVKQQSTTRENKVKRLIEKFENPHTKRIIRSGLDPDAQDQQVQQRNSNVLTAMPTGKWE